MSKFSQFWQSESFASARCAFSSYGKVFGLMAAAASVLSLLYSIIDIGFTETLVAMLTVYRKIFHFPFDALARLKIINLPTWLRDVLVLWTICSSFTARLFAIAMRDDASTFQGSDDGFARRVRRRVEKLSKAIHSRWNPYWLFRPEYARFTELSGDSFQSGQLFLSALATCIILWPLILKILLKNPVAISEFYFYNHAKAGVGIFFKADRSSIDPARTGNGAPTFIYDLRSVLKWQIAAVALAVFFVITT